MASILYPDSQYTRALSGAPNPAALVLQTSISNAINIAINDSLFSCKISVNGFLPLDVQTSMINLQAAGYQVALTNS